MLAPCKGAYFFYTPSDKKINSFCQEVFPMSKKTLKRKKVQIHLEPDGFSIHTFELSIEVSKSEWHNCKDWLYTEQEKSNQIWIYSDKACKGVYICTKYADIGIRIRLEHTSGKK